MAIARKRKDKCKMNDIINLLTQQGLHVSQGQNSFIELEVNKSIDNIDEIFEVLHTAHLNPFAFSTQSDLFEEFISQHSQFEKTAILKVSDFYIAATIV